MNMNVGSSQMRQKRRRVARAYVGWSPLHRAVVENKYDLVRALLKHSDTEVNCRTPEGFTGLYLVCKNPSLDLDVVKDVLHHGADPNIPNKRGVSPLHLACCRDSLELVNLLMRHHANINAQDCDDCSPLHYAIGSDLTEEFEYLPDSRPARRRKDLDLVQLLIHHHANVNGPDRQGVTPLHCAIKTKSRDLVQCLLENGADANLTQAQGLNALMLTLQDQFFNYITALISELPEINTSDEYDMFALLWQHTDVKKLAENKGFMRFVCEHCPLPFCYKQYELILKIPGIDLQVNGVPRLFCSILENGPPNIAAFDSAKTQYLNVIGWLLDMKAELLAWDVLIVVQHFCECSYKNEVWALIFSKTTPDITEHVVHKAITCQNYDLALLFVTYCVHLCPESVVTALQESGEAFLRKWFALFTPSIKYISKITDRQNPNVHKPSVEFVTGMIKVKSLLELSRDTVRLTMQDSCDTSQDFLAALERLVIPTYLKDILRLRAPVNIHVLEDESLN